MYTSTQYTQACIQPKRVDKNKPQKSRQAHARKCWKAYRVKIVGKHTAEGVGKHTPESVGNHLINWEQQECAQTAPTIQREVLAGGTIVAQIPGNSKVQNHADKGFQGLTKD